MTRHKFLIQVSPFPENIARPRTGFSVMPQLLEEMVMTALRRRMIEEMELAGLMEGTQERCLTAVAQLAKAYARPPGRVRRVTDARCANGWRSARRNCCRAGTITSLLPSPRRSEAPTFSSAADQRRCRRLRRRPPAPPNRWYAETHVVPCAWRLSLRAAPAWPIHAGAVPPCIRGSHRSATGQSQALSEEAPGPPGAPPGHG